MNTKQLLFLQLLPIATLALLHYVAIEYYLYWHYPWLDLVSHTLGGLWAGFFALWLRILFGNVPNLAWGIAGALLLGVAWEIFEVATGLTFASNYAFDTSLDLLMDAIGGFAAGFIAVFLMKRARTAEQALL